MGVSSSDSSFSSSLIFHHFHFGSDALSGGSQICLLFTTALCTLVGMAGYRIPWKEFECAIVNNITGVSTALIILLIIGALSAAWMLSGVVPTLIYYGVQIIHPPFPGFVLHHLCGGVCHDRKFVDYDCYHRYCLDGYRQGTRFCRGMDGRCHHFGRIFRRQDFTVVGYYRLASSVTETPLFTHIRYMMFTTVPSLIITLILFTVAGFFHTVNGTEHIALFTDGLSERFHISCGCCWFRSLPVF